MNADEGRRPQIGAVIAAAGQSKRMGTPKQLLPWGEHTVIETVVENLSTAGADPVVCVVGHLQEKMRAALLDSPATVVFNTAYRAGRYAQFVSGRHRMAGGSTLAGKACWRAALPG